MTRIAVNGIELNVEAQGDGPPLMLLHGFTGDVSTWEPFLDAWADFTTIRVDLIGHGRSDSPEDAERYTMQHAVDDLVALLDHLDIEQTALLGYSLGGRVALNFAVQHPQRLSALILESASAGIEHELEREARVVSDNALAELILRDGMDAFVSLWEKQPLFESQLRLSAEVQDQQRRRRLSQSPIGLANSLRGMGTGRQDYLMPRLADLHVRTLLLAGAIDGKYVGILRELEAALPDTSADILPDAGHAAHMEAPGRFGRAVKGFLVLVDGEGLNRRHMVHKHGWPEPGTRRL